MTTVDPAQIDRLIVRSQAGDRAAFGAVVEALMDDVRGFVAARTTTLDLVEEAVQSAFVGAYLHLDRYRPEGTFAAWVKGFARNALRNELAARSRAHATGREALEGLLARAALEDLDRERDAERRALDLDRVESCLQSLSPRARLIATRRFVDGVPLARMAQQFRQTRIALASALTRIRAALRACVAGKAVEAKHEP